MLTNKLFQINGQDRESTAFEIQDAIHEYLRRKHPEKALGIWIPAEEIEKCLKNYRIYKYTDMQTKSLRRALFRLTLPVFLLYLITIYCIVLPINWILTGSFRLPLRGRFTKLADYSQKWGDNIF